MAYEIITQQGTKKGELTEDQLVDGIRKWYAVKTKTAYKDVQAEIKQVEALCVKYSGKERVFVLPDSYIESFAAFALFNVTSDILDSV